MSDQEERELERQAQVGDRMAARTLAILRFRRLGDCGVALNAPSWRACRMGFLYSTCPSCRLWKLRREAVNLAKDADQRNWVRGFKTWSVSRLWDNAGILVQESRRMRRLDFLALLEEKRVGFAWCQEAPGGRVLAITFKPGLSPDDSEVYDLSRHETDSPVYAYYKPTTTNANRKEIT